MFSTCINHLHDDNKPFWEWDSIGDYEETDDYKLLLHEDLIKNKKNDELSDE